MRFLIHEDNFERLNKKATFIAKKCAKYGCDFNFEVVGEEFKTFEDEDGAERIARYIVVEAEGTAKINDWEFCAELEHTEKGNVIRGFGEHEVPERYYDAEPVCEHCGVKRFRRSTYIVHNTVTDEFKQVGKSCLKEFTCGMSVEAVAAYISMFDELIEGEAVSGSGYGKRYYEKEDLLAITIELVKRFGYGKRYDDNWTAGMLSNYLWLREGRLGAKYAEELREKFEKAGCDFGCAENVAKAREIANWIQNHEDNSNYFHSLKVVTALDYVDGSHFGILVSALPAYDKELEQERLRRIAEAKAKAEAECSEFVGEIGKRVEFTTDDVKVITSWESCYDGWHTTTTYMYKMVDADGNVFVWKTAKGIASETKFLVKGTVKNHNEYNGVKQTELTRCTLKVA